MQGKVETRVGIFVLAALAVLAYMGFHVGAFRFDKARYNVYTIHFSDISGLTRKAEVKIAGVKVGWIEAISLVPGDEVHARADIAVHRSYQLHDDAYGIVRQEGFLGPKYLEIIPGDPLKPPLNPGQELSQPSKAPVSTDELLQQFKSIATNVGEVAQSFKSVVGGPNGQEQLREIVANLQTTLQNMASVSQTLERSFGDNKAGVDSLLQVGQHIERIAQKLDGTVDVFQQACNQVCNGFESVHHVAQKIDQGHGIVGKLVNDDEAYRDIKLAINGIKNYVSQVDMMQIVFDSHFESMYRPAENYHHEDAKGYFDMRIHPREDYFYLVQLASSEKGYITRNERLYHYCDNKNEPVNPNTLNLDDEARLRFVLRRKKTKIDRYSLRLGLQFGKIYKSLALRFGLFEGTGGVAFDVDIPFNTEKFRWVTSFEAFDFYGWNRLHDRRPHLKWINRMFFFGNLYLTFGADDFVSKNNANAFFGAGVRFGDDDIKYLLPSVGGASGSVSCLG